MMRFWLNHMTHQNANCNILCKFENFLGRDTAPGGDTPPRTLPPSVPQL